MIRLSINLSNKHRLDLRFVKRRQTPLEKPLIPSLDEVLRTRKGNKFSRYFRHVFENKRIKKILGANIALMIIASSFMPVRASFDIEPEQTVISQEATPLTTEQGVQYPVENVRITQGYRFYHPGIDFDGITGETVRPIMSGIVKEVSYSRFAYGNAVLINHGNGITSLYAHLSEINVSEGQKVDINTKLGGMGATGRAWGDHLHLELRDHNYPINPLSVLPR